MKQQQQQHQLADKLVFRGCLEAALYNADTGEVVGYSRNNNAVVTAGRALVLQIIQSGHANSTQTIQQLAVGTDTTAPVTSDTALGSELTRKAVGTWGNDGLTATAGPYWVASVLFATDEANNTVGEAGLFNSSSGGTMLAHGTFATSEKTTSNTLGISYTISN